MDDIFEAIGSLLSSIAECIGEGICFVFDIYQQMQISNAIADLLLTLTEPRPKKEEKEEEKKKEEEKNNEKNNEPVKEKENE